MEPNDGLNRKQDDIKETAVASSGEMLQSTKQVSVDNSADDSIQDKPKKKSHAMVIGMVFLAILAIGGIGFGVWAMMDGNAKVAKKDEKISDLNTQLAEATRPVEEETTRVDEEIKTDCEEKNEDVDTADYIYVGEWGLKIRIADNLTNLSYEYLDDGYQRTCRTLGVSASTVGDGTKPAFVKTGSEKGDYLGYVSRCPKSDKYPYGAIISIEDTQYDYYYDRIQYSITQTDWETESVNAVKTMLTTSENYSKI